MHEVLAKHLSRWELTSFERRGKRAQSPELAILKRGREREKERGGEREREKREREK